MSRRSFVRRLTTAAGLAGAASYLAFAPEEYPLSLRDFSGRRSKPQTVPWTLPNFGVAPPKGKAEIGIGRAKTVRQRLIKSLDAVGGIEHYIKPGDIVLVKPNVAFDRSPELGATTNPEILAALLDLLIVDCRVREVRVADNPIESPADCFVKSGIERVVAKAGGRISLPDSNSFRDLYTPGASLIETWPFFFRPFSGVDKVIGLAPVKDHNLCSASMSIKNWYGLLGGRRNQFHQDIHGIISDLSILIRPTLSILDGSRILMRNGPTGGDPAYVKRWDVAIAGTDQVAMDTWAFVHLLEREESRLPQYLFLAEKKGGGKMDAEGRIREIA